MSLVMLIKLAVNMLIGLGATALISVRLGEARKERNSCSRLYYAHLAILVLTVLGIAFLNPCCAF